MPNAVTVSDTYIAKIIARKDTCEATAAANHEKIAQAFMPFRVEFDKRMNDISAMKDSRRKRIAAFLALVSDFRAVAAPYVPCKKGCSGCCHQRVVITTTEAEYIHGKTGIAPRTVIPNSPIDPVSAFGAGTPCTFLDAEGNCSIYEVRPFQCRNLVNIDEDNLLCQPENMELKAQKHPAALGVPQLMGGSLNILYDRVVGNDARNDIRTFFPK